MWAAAVNGWDIALVIFIASIAVPGIKFGALTLLLITVQRGSLWARKERSKQQHGVHWKRLSSPRACARNVSAVRS